MLALGAELAVELAAQALDRLVPGHPATVGRGHDAADSLDSAPPSQARGEAIVHE